MRSTIEHEVTPDGHSKSGCRSVAGKFFISLFLLVFFGMGSFFLVVLVREFARETATYLWRATPATVISSGIEETGDDEDPYRWSLSYRYSFEGGEYTSSQVALSPQGSSNYDKVQRKAFAHREGSTFRCWVNPKRPEQAVIERRNPLFILFALLPLIFVVIGGGGLYFVWRREAPKAETVSISKKAVHKKRAMLMPIVLGLIFVAVGGALFVGFGVLPALGLLRAASWDETPCTIVSSTVRSHSSDDGTTYKVDILYEYQAEGFTLRSNRYDFVNFSSSGYQSKREIVDRYPTGTHTVCYVNPRDPTWAVLNRDFRLAYLVGLLPLIFLLTGAAVTKWGIKQRRQASARTIDSRESEAAHEISAGPAVLEAGQSRAGKIIGGIIFALIWNGIVSVFLYILISEWSRGDRQWFLAIFLVPFVLVGLAAIVMVFHFILAAFNPRPRITLSQSEPRLGDRLLLDWRFDGRPQRIQQLEIFLEGREEATYQRGTDTHTDREVFARIPIADSSVDYEIAQGNIEVAIPDDTMHSFAGDNNKIVWSLKVAGDIPRWPDVDDEFEIKIRPLAVEDMW
jgi:hypothetical protein